MVERYVFTQDAVFSNNLDHIISHYQPNVARHIQLAAEVLCMDEMGIPLSDASTFIRSCYVETALALIAGRYVKRNERKIQ